MKRREFIKISSGFIAVVSLAADIMNSLSSSITKRAKLIKIPLKKFRISDIYTKHDLAG